MKRPSTSDSDAVKDRGESDLEWKNRLPAAKLVSFYLLLIGSGGVFTVTVSEPDRHPLLLALSLSWLIAFFASAFTAKLFLRMNPMRHRFMRWEREGRAYERMGIGAFRLVVLHTPLGWLNPLVKGSFDLDRLLRVLSMAEDVHWVGGGIALVCAAWYFLAGYASVGIWLVLASVPLHLYAVMLQRWNRGRVWRVQRRADALRQKRGKEGFAPASPGI